MRFQVSGMFYSTFQVSERTLQPNERSTDRPVQRRTENPVMLLTLNLLHSLLPGCGRVLYIVRWNGEAGACLSTAQCQIGITDRDGKARKGVLIEPVPVSKFKPSAKLSEGSNLIQCFSCSRIVGMRGAM